MEHHFPIGLHGPLSNVFGGSFVGNLLTAICFGAISVQSMRYFDVFYRDMLSTRAVVTFLWLVEGFQLACVTQSMWHYFVKGFGNPLLMRKATWQFSIYQIGSVTSSATVQTFFAYRVYSLSNSIPLGVLVELFAVVQCAFGIAISVAANRTLIFPVFVEKYTWLVLSWLACQAAADLVICSAMVLLLRARRTGFKNTDTVLNIMTFWTINTGVVTALFSMVIFVAFAKGGFHYVVLTLGLPLGGFYTFTMMANLHSRTKIAEHWGTSHCTPSGAQSWRMTNLSAHKPGGIRRHTASFLTDTYDDRNGHAPVVIDVIQEREIVNEDGACYPHLPKNTTPARASLYLDSEEPTPKKHSRNITFLD